MKLLQIALPNAVEDEYSAIGIDFGTTNSLVAHEGQGGISIISGLVPSAVAIRDGDFIMGHEALAIKGCITSIKRFLSVPDIATMANTMGYECDDARLKLGDRWLTPIEISAKIFSHLRQIIRIKLGEDVIRAVITVPAFYDDIARQKTREAAQMAGFEVMRLISEPTAAAYAYGIDQKSEGIYCVYDFGGGTFDVSVLSMQHGCFRVIATKGDLLLGGDDIDRDIANALRIDIGAAREVKESFSCATHHSQLHVDLLSRDAFHNIVAPYLERTVAIVDQVLNDAGVSAANLAGIILVGGSVRMLEVRELLSDRYAGVPLYDNTNPDEVVVCGAAMRAYAINSGSSRLLLDVTPLSLGLETIGGVVEKIIHRNTPIPISKTQIFTTYSDGQTGIIFTVCQGESEHIEGSRVLAKFLLPVEPKEAGAHKIEVTFTLDADGSLSVSAVDENTGARHRVEVIPSYGLTADDMIHLIGDYVI